MTSTLDRIRRAYLVGRLRLAIVGALPSFVYVGAALAVSADRSACVIGLAQFAFAALLLFLGRPYSRGVALGYLFGIVPFVTATVAQGAGHMCLDGACMAVCAPACTAAGFVTGIGASLATVRVRGGLGSFVATAGVVLAAGAMGCRCLGYGSLLGLAGGMLLASVPAMPRLWADTQAT